MKKNLISFIISILTAIILIELFHIGTGLMNQPNSILFYIGLLLIGLEMFFIGWSIGKLYVRFFGSKEKNVGNKE